MYCVEALGCLSVYIDTEVYVYMQVYSAIVLLALKKNQIVQRSWTVNCQLSRVNCQLVQRSRTTHCQLSSVNCQLSTVNCQLGVTLRATVVHFSNFLDIPVKTKSDIAVTPTSPLNPIISSTQNQSDASIITLEWDPPSFTGGVSVSYVLTISPIPLSGSPVTVETTSTQITVSYNTRYNVTIRAVNCAGNSSDVMVVVPSIG